MLIFQSRKKSKMSLICIIFLRKHIDKANKIPNIDIRNNGIIMQSLKSILFSWRMSFSFIIVFLLSIFLSSSIIAQKKIVKETSIHIYGTIKNTFDGKPVQMGTIIFLEARKKTTISATGQYSLILPKAGTYTIYIVTPSYQKYNRKFVVANNDTILKDFYIQPKKTRGASINVRGKREIQTLSRYTMSVEELKEVPGSFGDSLNALTSMPGIIRSGGFIGPMIIRGMSDEYNRYYIDNIPIPTPYHFGGLHSIINSDLMSEIDVFSSSGPAEYGQTNAAIIHINTIDSVKEQGGNAEINIFSANALIKVPVYIFDTPLNSGTSKKRENNQADGLAGQTKKISSVSKSTSPEISSQKNTKKPDGYWIASGRYSYFSLFLPTIAKMATGNTLELVPEYFDYQLKGKLFLNKNNSIKLLMFGFKDFFKIADNSLPEDQKEAVENGQDPLVFGAEFEMATFHHSYGLYYTYKPSDKFKNEILTYASLTKYHFFASLPKSAWLEEIYTDTTPDTYGVKENLFFEWLEDHAKLFLTADFTFYNFGLDSKSIMPKKNIYTQPNLSDPNLFDTIYTNSKVKQYLTSASIKNKFTFAGLSFVPGIRFDYLSKNKQLTYDYRARIDYQIDRTDTVISASYGTYSSFNTINAYYFNRAPSIAEKSTDYDLPYRSIHRAIGIEQKISLFTLKLEGFSNNSYDGLSFAPHCSDASIPNSDSTCDTGEWRAGYYTATYEVYGFELLFRKDYKKGRRDFFGWIAYTYQKSQFKSGLDASLDPYGQTEMPGQYDQRHSLKFVGGYTYGNHKFSAKFQLYTSFPYTPIINGQADTSYKPVPEFASDPNTANRYVPIYGEPNSGRYPIDHQLDLRYTYANKHEWGKVSFYLELLNVYNYKTLDNEEWSYNEPYSSTNPELTSGGGFDFIMPNFGVEVKF